MPMDNNRYCVIMAGGIGSRVWPLSREERPKQFVDVVGAGRTFIQLTFDRFTGIIPRENFLVVTNRRYKSMVLEQLPELDESQVLCEPMRRNTAPCIAYAVHRIASVNPAATVVFAPADHLIMKHEEFERVIDDAMGFAASNNVLMTIGVTPTRPETGYGYIQKGEPVHDNTMYKVKLFTEKPNLEMAKVFVSTGEFLWNSGIFVWSIAAIIDAFDRYLPDIEALFANGADLYSTDEEQTYINSIYSECPNISIDYGIMEHADNVYVRQADLGWSDIGTWGALYAMADKGDNDNVTGNKELSTMLLNDVKESIIKLSDGKKAIIDGLEGYILIDDGDTLLVCRRDREQDIRTWVEMINNDGHEK